MKKTIDRFFRTNMSFYKTLFTLKKTNFSFFLASIVAALFAVACSVDSYDKGEGEYSLLTAEMADATVGSDKFVKNVETDEGEQFTLAKPGTATWIEKGDTTYRTLLYYKKMSNGQIEAVSMRKAGVMRPGKQENVKTDPLYVESIWMGKNRKYVNMRLRLLTGASEDEKAVQTLGIVRDTKASSGSHEHLVLYHDQGGQPEYYSTTTFVSIPLSEISADTLTITINTYDGLYSKTLNKRQ